MTLPHILYAIGRYLGCGQSHQRGVSLRRPTQTQVYRCPGHIWVRVLCHKQFRAGELKSPRTPLVSLGTDRDRVTAYYLTQIVPFQLCINYCNEKLQFHFNEHIFVLEQSLYESEGIKILATAFKDNQPTLDLLEAKVTGIFSMVDEEISVPRGSDEGLLTKIIQRHDTKHPNMIKPKPNSCKNALKCFGVQHYAGPVFYNVTFFLEKNKDQLHPEIIGVLKTSSSAMFKDMFQEDSASASDKANSAKRLTSTKAAAKTLGSQFKTQLNELMATLNATFPHFVRCMKPNDEKAGNLFNAGRMQDQLRYAGLVEVCRIRKQGFPVRRDHEPFFKRYRCIVILATNVKELMAGMEEKGILKDGEWAIGRTKIFMRTKQAQEVELAREFALLSVVKAIQKIARGYLMRNKYKYFKSLLQNVKDGISKRDEKILTEALDMSAELPHGGGHLKIIQQAKVLQARLREERRVLVLLENALVSREINALRSALSATVSMNPPFNPPILVETKALIERLELELEVRNSIVSAVAARDKQALILHLARAAELELDCNETRQGLALKVRLDEEEQAILHLKQAVLDRQLSSLTHCIDKCQEMGLEVPELATARTLQARLQLEAQALSALSSAIAERNLDVLLTALERARTLGLDESYAEVLEGQAVRAKLEREAEIIVALEAATDSRNLTAVEEALETAEAAGLTAESCESFQSAAAMRKILLAEREAMNNLIAAVKADVVDVYALSNAIS